MTIFVIALENLYSTVAGILAGVLAVGETLLITGIILCVFYRWRRRMKSVKINVEQLPQDTYLAPISSGNMPPKKIRQDKVCYFNSITNNIS